MRRLLPVVALTVVLAGCGGNGLYAATPVITLPATSPASDPRIGTEVIPIEDREPLVIAGMTSDDKPLSTADLTGDIVVVNAWASWCPPCREELPLLRGVAEAFAEQDVTFVGLNVKDDPFAAAGILSSSIYDSIADPEGALLASIPGVPPSALPSTVVIDRSGRLAARIIGPVRPGQLEAVIGGLIIES